MTNRALLLSQLLALHLDRQIQRYREPEPPMNKILEAAKLVADRKKQWDERAQALIDDMPALESMANQAFERPEGLLAQARQDFKDLHATFDAMNAVSNSEKNPEAKGEAAGSDSSSASFPAGQSPTPTG